MASFFYSCLCSKCNIYDILIFFFSKFSERHSEAPIEEFKCFTVHFSIQ